MGGGGWGGVGKLGHFVRPRNNQKTSKGITNCGFLMKTKHVMIITTSGRTRGGE